MQSKAYLVEITVDFLSYAQWEGEAQQEAGL